MTGKDSDALIAALADTLKPVVPMRPCHGLSALAGSSLLVLVLVWVVLGFHDEVLAGRVPGLFILANGLFLMMGLSAGAAVVAMAQPQTGAQHSGWRWAAGGAALVPLSALAMIVPRIGRGSQAADEGLTCALLSAALALMVVAGLTIWLRRGAPTRPGHAGFLTGLSGGGIGAFALGLHCPVDDLLHVGLWHGAGILLAALLGRLVIPMMVRW